MLDEPGTLLPTVLLQLSSTITNFLNTTCNDQSKYLHITTQEFITIIFAQSIFEIVQGCHRL